MSDLLSRAMAKLNAAQQEAPVEAPESFTDNTPAPVSPELSDLLHYISSLSEEMKKEHPELPTYMQIIHKKIVEYPELVHLLTDEQIGVVYQAALKQSNIILVKVKEKTEKASARKLSQQTLSLGQDW